MISRLFLFDIDGTLLRFRPWAGECFARVLKELTGVQCSIRDIPYSGLTDLVILRELLRHHGKDMADFPTLWEDFLERYPRCIHNHLPEGYQIDVLPGIREVVALLDERPGCALGIVTGNIEVIARLKLELAGLHTYFPIGAYATDSEHRPALVALALDRARRHWNREFLPENTWVIGDSPHDVLSGKVNGCRTLAVATGFHTFEDLHGYGPDICVRTLGEPFPAFFEPTLAEPGA